MGRPKNFNRTEVLEKAMPLFWKRGFADTGLQDLEKATGVNKSGLYTEFKNKEDIFLESLRHYSLTRKGRGLLSELPLGWDNVERFLKYRMVNKVGMKGCFAVNSMRELELLPAQGREIVAEHMGALKKLVLENIAAEKTGMAPKQLAEITMTFFSGLCIEENLKAGKAQVPTVQAFMRFLRSA